MEVQKAQDLFLSKTGYNCAQSVLKAFEKHKPLAYEQYKAYGHGGSNGKCGALAAAQVLCNDAISKEIEAKFIDKAGSSLCREIRRLNKLNCAMCVKEGAALVKEYLCK
ncbi:MAG: C-GCAxxG-C-C family (seleno)protein [Candidatus Omnitrophica bacterium]|nr:C-GCAxxG-C-C family (seleno)protein [Candidatus Omnitrophota bacterium]MDD5441110.1 C-GCAxxG-C-C family (seleno)protein [Candidatus Omnitrophota bacterium]